MTEPASGEVRSEFQAEVGRLLHLMVHSVYTDKEIFLRELISNASDACDKLRYEAIATPTLLGPDETLAITLRADSEADTLIIADNGIGMDRSELIDNLGTIARSGTKAFLEKLGDKPEGAALIGQFGVGFYSAFMVADEIEVVSRKAGSDQAHTPAHTWRSDGMSGFSIAVASEADSALVARGTLIRLKIKSDARQFLDPDTLERIVRTYSDHILFPVSLLEEGEEPRQVNTAGALWQRPKSEVTPEQYAEAYRTLSGSFDGPKLTIHYKAEGRQAYAVMLFVPEQRPFDLYDASRKGRVKLYVRRVFITDDADLLPPYMRFVRGVVDSEDVPLNISREMLQNNPLVSQIRKALTARVLSELEGFAARDEAGYEQFFDAFGAVLKEALYEDYERREQVLNLSRFKTSGQPGWVSLKAYVDALRPNQTAIYYLTGDSLERLKASPQLEAAHARGIDVLLLTDAIDAFWVSSGVDFGGKPFKSLSQGDLDLSLVPTLEAAAPPAAELEGSLADLLARFKDALGAEVSDVRPSTRLVASAVCLVAPQHGPDLGLDKLLARQDRAFGMKPVLEINGAHPLVAKLVGAQGDLSAAEVGDYAHLLLDQARILDGGTPSDPARFADSLNRFAVLAMAGKH